MDNPLNIVAWNMVEQIKTCFIERNKAIVGGFPTLAILEHEVDMQKIKNTLHNVIQCSKDIRDFIKPFCKTTLDFMKENEPDCFAAKWIENEDLGYCEYMHRRNDIFEHGICFINEFEDSQEDDDDDESYVASESESSSDYDEDEDEEDLTE